jgi:aminoglycoside phosphotransferase (APT) family kinase protein
MTNMWDKTTDITEAMIRTLLKNQCGLTVDTISPLGEGFDNSAFLINSNLVFRFPHRQQALACMENEIALLPYYKEKLSFAVPDVKYIGKATRDYSYPFVGYQLLQGELLSTRLPSLTDNIDFATTLGSWLKELHELPLQASHLANIQGAQDWRLDIANRTQKMAEILEQYGDEFKDGGFDPVELNAMMESFEHLHILEKQVYVHGDLYAKHIVVNKEGLPAGLIDWGDTHIGHPAIDLSVGVMLFEMDALHAFFNAYGHFDQDLLDIAIFRAFCHALGAYAYFCQKKDYPTMLWTERAIYHVIHLMKTQ